MTSPEVVAAVRQADRECLSCGFFGGEHAALCPHVTGGWPSHGDEVCGLCGHSVGAVYTHLTEQDVDDEQPHDRIVCLGCKARAQRGGT